MNTRIQVKPDQLEELSKQIGKQEEKQEKLIHDLTSKYGILMMSVTDHMGEVIHTYSDLMKVCDNYLEKLDHTQAIVEKTAKEFQEEDEKFMNAILLEIIGWNDVVRTFGEYDPVTGDKITGWQRAEAAFWTVLNIATTLPVTIEFKPLFFAAKAVRKGKVIAQWLEKSKNVINPLSKWITGMVNRAWKGVVNKAGQALSWVKKQPIIPIPRREPKGALAFPGGGGSFNLGDFGFRIEGEGIDDVMSRFSKSGGTKGMGNPTVYDTVPNDSYAYQQYKKVLMKDDIISNSDKIINGAELWDQKAVDMLTKDGSNINDWWKMESKYSYSTEFGEGKIHYYQNAKTGEINPFDSKLKVSKPKNLRADSKDLFWIIDLDENFVPTKMR